MRLGDPEVWAMVSGLALLGCSGSDPVAGRAPDPGTRAGSGVVLSRGTDGRVRVLSSPGQAPLRADVELPALGDGPVVVRDRVSGMKVAFALAEGGSAAAEVAGSVVRYRGAAPGGADVVQRPNRSGTEDFVTFRTRPAVEAVHYRVNVEAAAGLRLVEGTLELLDREGAPRLRMGAPYLVDARGRWHRAAVHLEDCRADVGAEAPWGRAVTRPGRSECSVRVAWGGERDALEYPAVLDPAWTSTTNTLGATRRAHTATLLSTGKVLIVGGNHPGAGTSITHLASAELFDPTTSTFAATSSLTDARSHHVAVRLAGGDVLVAGGVGPSGTIGTTEIYDATTPGWRTVDALVQSRQDAAAVLVSTDAVLVAGGLDATGAVLDASELFDPVSEKWTDAGRMADKRAGHFLTPVSNGVTMVVGGYSTSSFSDVATCELYTSSSGPWTAAATLSVARRDFAGARLASGKVLVAGGFSRGLAANTPSAEVFDGLTGAWSSAGTLGTARMLHSLTALQNGGAVAAGGVVTTLGAITSYLATTELYDPESNAWTPLADLSEARHLHTATLLDDGRVLVTGGEGATGVTDSAEILGLDALGTDCTVATTCASGFCADGVCCDAACTDTCNACVKTATGKNDGTCALVQAAKDPRGDCLDDGAPACQKDGLCDGAGACEMYAGTPCTPTPCGADSDCTSGHCADSVCCDTACAGTCEACAATLRGSGDDGTCGPIEADTDPDAECPSMGAGVCEADGVCNGSGACSVPTEGTACDVARCSDAVTLAAAATCGAAGDCTPATTSCVPFRCDATALRCSTTCTADGDCAPKARCRNGACELNPNGTACAAPGECASGICADGVCCDAACEEQCEACDVAGSEGTCSPVIGPPHAGRTACFGEETCGGSCDGLVRGACGYPDASTLCGALATCTDGAETAGRCNGIGACLETTRSCAPFACGTDACLTECTTSSDCDAEATCSPDGVCTTPGSTCADGGPAGPDGGCGNPPAARSEDDGGCGCRTVSTGPRRSNERRERRGESPLACGALLLLSAAALRRRRPWRRLGDLAKKGPAR